MNLASNAAEAISGSGTVRISTECRYLDRPVSGYENVNEGDYVVLTVSDNGEGITPKDLEKVFEPFYTKKKMGRSGTGLGLSICYSIVELHSGTIEVQNSEGEGCLFTVRLPMTGST